MVDYSTNKRGFTSKQKIEIGTKAFKEFAIKVKSGVKMHKGQFAYFNGLLTSLSMTFTLMLSLYTTLIEHKKKGS